MRSPIIEEAPAKPFGVRFTTEHLVGFVLYILYYFIPASKGEDVGRKSATCAKFLDESESLQQKASFCSLGSKVAAIAWMSSRRRRSKWKAPAFVRVV